MKRFRHIICVLLASVFFSSCESVFQYPTEDAVDPTLVNADVEIELNLTTSLEFYTYATAGSISRSDDSDEYLLRSIVELYNSDDLSKPIRRDILYTEYDISKDQSVQLSYQLNAKMYKMAVWSDVVSSDDCADLYYVTDDLSLITNMEPYVGSDDNKQAFAGQADLDLTEFRYEWNAVYKCNIEMARPLARFEIITTDIAEFIETRTKANEAIGTKSETKADYNNYTIKLNYDGYMPYGYDLFTDKPNDSRQGVSFTSNLELLSDDEARIGFDHILVNHNESQVNVSMTVYNPEGEEVTKVNSISIPLLRDKNTIIKGDFLTRDYVPGIGINPEFDGEINVVIP